MTLWEHLENICFNKKYWRELNEDEKKTANIYMINRFVSMHFPYIEIVNEIQTLGMAPNMVYDLYVGVLPKQQKFFKYIKKSIKEGKSDSIEILAKIFEISKTEAKDYLNLLDKKQLKELTEQFKGIKDKKK